MQLVRAMKPETVKRAGENEWIWMKEILALFSVFWKMVFLKFEWMR
ncbi:hypothetical protein HMPREF1051_1379 [Neisseria sicca VK64]|uniref:Uncharacterized protein n=1 Tax=Neisseria sicca VK64 TaxID=1095748 RepID=I2NVV2_NEISI|nr:hypothetical protein HMPREF1051_1379 [Neisseria sicca VK64]